MSSPNEETLAMSSPEPNEALFARVQLWLESTGCYEPLREDDVRSLLSLARQSEAYRMALEEAKDRIWALENKIGDRDDDPLLSGAKAGGLESVVGIKPSTFMAPAPRPIRERRLEAQAIARAALRDQAK